MPKIIQNAGLSNNSFKIDPDVIDHIIDQYCRDPGIRSLEKYTKKIIEKVKNIF